MKRAAFLLIILLGFGIAISQINQNESNSSIALTLKPYYFVNETFNFSVNPELNFSAFNILNSSFERVAENISSNYSLDLPPGTYYLETNWFFDGKNYTNLTIFEVVEPEIDVYPRVVFVNESFFVLIKDHPNKFFGIKIYPKFFYNFTSFNETTILEFNLDESGNYTVFVNEKSFDVQVLPYIGDFKKKAELSIEISSNDVFTGEILPISVKGTPDTFFNLELFFEGIKIMQIIDKTDEHGFYFNNVSLKNPGNYELLLEYDGNVINESIKVMDIPVNFKIDNLKSSGNVSFDVVGPPLKDFSLYFDAGNLSKIYYMRTGSDGKCEFSDYFNEGEYNLSIVYEGKKMLETKISVKPIEKASSNIVLDNSYLELDYDASGDGFAIYIKGNNITLDCKGKKVISNNIGIIVEGSSMVRLMNCFLENNKIGVLIENSSSVKIVGFNTFNNTNGIVAKNSSDVSVRDSDLTGVEFYGVLLFSSSGNVSNSMVKTNTNIDVLYSLKN
jgi:hypothetical protein